MDLRLLGSPWRVHAYLSGCDEPSLLALYVHHIDDQWPPPTQVVLLCVCLKPLAECAGLCGTARADLEEARAGLHVRGIPGRPH